MEIDQIKELINCLEASKISKLVYKKGDLEIQLDKEPERAKAQPIHFVPNNQSQESAFSSDIPYHGERGGTIRKEELKQEGGSYVTSPMVGTFYCSAAPDQPPFVKVGDKVSEHTVVCIIEAMKVMNEVKAGVSGTVKEILVDNAQPVEFGTKLLRIQ